MCFVSNQGNSVDENQVEAHFRGRKLKGVQVDLPKGYQGYIIKASRRPHDMDEDGEFARTESKISQLTVWEHDDLPTTSNNSVLRSLAWLEMAKAVRSALI